MTLDSESAPPDEGTPADYGLTHPRDHADTWGWHGEWGKWSHLGGWISVAALLLLTTATHYHVSWTVTLISAAVLLASVLLRDRLRRRPRIRPSRRLPTGPSPSWRFARGPRHQAVTAVAHRRRRAGGAPDSRA